MAATVKLITYLISNLEWTPGPEVAAGSEKPTDVLMTLSGTFAGNRKTPRLVITREMRNRNGFVATIDPEKRTAKIILPTEKKGRKAKTGTDLNALAKLLG